MIESQAPPGPPLLIWDGECGFCRRWIGRWRKVTGDRVTYEPYQSAAARFPQIPRERFAAAVHLIESDGQVSSGAEAAFRSLAYAPGHGAWFTLYRRLPLFAALSEAGYRAVASRRGSLPHW